MVDLKTISGGEGAPAGELSPDELARFVSQYASDNEVIGQLLQSYQQLHARFAALHDELAQANAELRAALTAQSSTAAYLQNILTSVQSGVISVDLEGRVRHYNRAAERIFGVPADQVLGKPYADALPDETPSAARALRGPHATCDGEKVYTDSSGTPHPLAVSTSVLTDDEGRVQGAVEILNDLSRLRSLEEQVTNVKALALLGEMAATVAHEVRNPLGGIAGFAGLLARDFESDDERRALTDKIIRGCDNLNRIVTNLLEYARPLRLERRHCDVCAELQEELALFEQDQERRGSELHIERQFDEHIPRGNVDPVQLRLALHNILINAADAAGRGAIQCGVTTNSDGGQPDRLCIWVSDNGPGIPHAHRDKVFTPFFTTKDKGTGLGLAMVRKVIEAHCGTVVLTAGVAGGTRIELRLPLG